ncbi:MAG TPA: glutathione S-transferase family protein [Candidatus Dormibacteraeota bacterium]|nr:glutathione S-transferase family protein [Candidatus Dormibacteraeota bacterium]
MLTLYDNPFSPFARKVRLVLAFKGLRAESVDALALAEHEALRAVNPRAEVPVLVDDGLVVTNSADIVAYLEDRYPDPPVLPRSPAARVAARAWERLADAVLDAIVHDISIWIWPTHRRPDAPPAGLIEAGLRDIGVILARLDAALAGREFLCGELSIADLALFPHLSSLKPLGIALDPLTHPQLAAWNQRLRALPIVGDDLAAVKRAAIEKFGSGPSPYEGEKIVWRGDRLEWLFHHGFADWWMAERHAGRAVVPSSL